MNIFTGTSPIEMFLGLVFLIIAGNAAFVGFGLLVERLERWIRRRK